MIATLATKHTIPKNLPELLIYQKNQKNNCEIKLENLYWVEYSILGMESSNLIN
jgi:hypothetical protein